MDLTPHVESLGDQLALTAEASGEEAQALAQRLFAPLSAAARLTLLAALSEAAQEINRALQLANADGLPPEAVEMRLRGVDPEFVVSAQRPSAPASHGFETAGGEEGASARITFRLPEQLKLKAEEAAGREGLSVNAWLVRTVAAALTPERERAPRGRSADQWGTFNGWVR